jgi:hypothetical protein
VNDTSPPRQELKTYSDFVISTELGIEQSHITFHITGPSEEKNIPKKLSSFAPDGHFLRDGQVRRQFWKRQKNSVRDIQIFGKNNPLLRCDAMTFEHYFYT